MLLTNLITALLAYIIDKIFGEFTFFKHPVILIGDIISFFEEKFYKDSVIRGILLVIFVLGVMGVVSYLFYSYLALMHPLFSILISAFIASLFIAHNMLRDSVGAIIDAQNKQEAIAMLVSRDTKDLSESDIYKAAIETYAENLSDGVIAPLFYLTLFGLPGILLYKTINTLDSMVGYRNERYEKYGKAAAILDDIANYIPARITALLIMLIAKKRPLLAFYKDGKKHDSPNAGHPITAMALKTDTKLGGPTAYFGEIKEKAYFGEGEEHIKEEHLRDALDSAKLIDRVIITGYILTITAIIILQKFL